MEGGQAVPSYLAGIVLTLVIGALLFSQERRQRPDLVGRVKADAYRAMLRALLVLLAGLLLALGAAMAGSLPPAGIVRFVAFVLIAAGGLAFLARSALYTLRIKPELDRWQEPVVATLAGIAGDAQSPEE